MDKAVENSQVLCILNDLDVKIFYKKLLGELTEFSGNALKVKNEIESE